MATKNENTHHQGTVKDPENDGRLKENREAGRTKGTTPASAARREHGGQSDDETGSAKAGGAGGGRSGDEGGGKSSGGGEADDLKSREYRDKDGNIHHHTRKKMEA
jgi:hypothetical protein